MDFSGMHQMEMIKEHESGAQEWGCPVCGRMFVMTWPPRYKKVTLVEGDVNASHSGGMGGIVIGGMSISPKDSDVPLNTVTPVTVSNQLNPMDFPDQSFNPIDNESMRKYLENL